jgi:cell division protein FtsW (lipid II flippase)
VSSHSVSGGGSKRSLVIILAVLAVIALVLAILWMTGAAPSFLNSGSHVKGSGHHLYRGIAALVAAVVLGAGAWWAGKKP